MMTIVNFILRRPSCDHVMLVLQQYLDGEVSATEAKRVSGHLDRCAGCAGEAALYRRVQLAVRENPAEDIDLEVLDRLNRFLHQLVDQPGT